MGRHDGHLLLVFERAVEVAERVVGLVLVDVLGEARVGEVGRGWVGVIVAVQSLEGVGG